MPPKPFVLKSETRQRTTDTHAEHLAAQRRWNAEGRHARVLLFGHSHIERLLRPENGVELPRDWFVSGVGGDRLCHALWRLRKDDFLQSFRPPPEQCVLWIGNNDIGMMSLPKFEPAWTTLIRAIKEVIPTVHVVSLVRGQPGSGDDAAQCELRRGLNDVLRNVCEGTGARYLDLFDALSSADMFVEDGVHFNAVGYRTIASALRAAVDKGEEKEGAA